MSSSGSDHAAIAPISATSGSQPEDERKRTTPVGDRSADLGRHRLGDTERSVVAENTGPNDRSSA